MLQTTMRSNGAGMSSKTDASANDDRTTVARKPVGAPQKMSDGRRVQVYLDADSLAIAERLGDGNVSAGIRAALKRAAGGPTPD